MNRLFVFAGALVLGTIVAAAGARADDKDISIKEIMTKAHKGGDAIIAKARAAAKSKDFEKLSDSAKELVKLGKDLGKAKPPAGEAPSWKKLTGTYVRNAEALQKAASAKDANGAQKALKGIGGSCKGCHDAHKG